MTLCAFGLIPQSAMAARLLMEGPGIALELQSGIMAGTLDDGIQTFSSDDLSFMQEQLAEDGINTAGHISMLLAETGNGFAFINLFDGSATPLAGGTNDSTLGFNSLIGGDAEHHWNTDSGGMMSWYDFGITQMADGTFEWQTGATSEGFAWSNLQEGEAGTVSFVDLGLDKLIPDMMFQYLTFNGVSWEVAAYDDFDAGAPQYNVSFYVTDVPGPAVIPLLALAAMHRRRRRH